MANIGTANNISNIYRIVGTFVYSFTQSQTIILTFFVGQIFFEQYKIDQNYLQIQIHGDTQSIKKIVTSKYKFNILDIFSVYSFAESFYKNY